MDDTLADLPDEVRDLIEPHQQGPAINQAMLDAISVAISKKRDEAKQARTTSGIEHTWKECEEAYAGIDDANRAEFMGARWDKPMSSDGPVSTGKKPANTDHKSTVFVRLTARYVDAGAAKLGEILLPPGEKAFSFTETPVPTLIEAKDDDSQVVHDGLGNIPLTRPAQPHEIPPPSMGAFTIPPRAPVAAAVSPPPGTAPAPAVAPAAGAVPAGAAGGAPQVPLTVKDLAAENVELARKKAKAAEKRIHDWMIECLYQSEVRKVIFDAARAGVGVLKGPFPKIYRGMAVSKKEDGSLAVQTKEELKPAEKWIDFWNFFPDPACGENVHDGDFVFERDYLSPRQVNGLSDEKGYIKSQLDKVIEQGPAKGGDAKDNSGREDTERKGRYEVWYFYGSLKREEMDCICDASGMKKEEGEQKQVYVIVTLINDTVVRANISPLDTGAFPYHPFPWQRRAGHWAGTGVSEQIRTPQKMLNAATRGMLNNAGKSSGSQIIVNQTSVIPADGSWSITPDKLWWFTGTDQGEPDVRAAMAAFQIPNTTAQLMSIVEYALRLAEESTSIPLITQGQSGPTTPDTFGAAQLQNNNANQLLRSIGYNFDDYITDPVVRQNYEWLLLDPEVPDEEKGDFAIDAHGSIALVERAIQDQTIAQLGATVANQIYGLDPKKWAEIFLKTKHIDPKDMQYTEEEQERMANAPPVKAPAVEAAQIRAEADLKKSQQDDETKKDIAVGVAHVQMHDTTVQYQMAMLEYANKHQITIDQVKGMLASKAMDINAERVLNAQNNAHDMHKHLNPPEPPVQAPGKAADGHAFDQANA